MRYFRLSAALRLVALAVTPVVAGQLPPLSPGDADAVACICPLPGRWNKAAAPLVRDYLDPRVPAYQWVQSALNRIGEMRSVVIEMQACTLAIQSPGLRRPFQDFASNYRKKLDAVAALHFAVSHGDQEAEQQARQALAQASAEGQALGQAFLDRLRSYVDPQTLAAELAKRGRQLGELLRPR